MKEKQVPKQRLAWRCPECGSEIYNSSPNFDIQFPCFECGAVCVAVKPDPTEDSSHD